MTLISRIKSLHLLRTGGLLALGLIFAGCNRDQIKVQEVPKDSDQAVPAPMQQPAAAPAMPMNPHAGMDMGGGPAGPAPMKWTTPDGWEVKPPSEFRVASFDAKGKDGQIADVAIIPMPTTGREVDLVNMWRQQMQLPAVNDADADKLAQNVPVGSDQGKLFEFASEQPIAGANARGRMLVAMLGHDGTSYFFKMTGEDAAVTEQKSAFLQFLKSISFVTAPAETAAANPHAGMAAGMGMGTTPEAAPVANSSLPAGWAEIPNPPMLLAKYVIQGSGDAKAEVNISMLSGIGGGVMANVTRWRNQLGLPPISEEDWSKQARTMDVNGVQGTVVDLTGTDPKTGKKSRLIGVIVPQSGATSFYKLMGDEQIVEQQKDVFTKFIQTAKFGD
jgi:hypothetical protein